MNLNTINGLVLATLLVLTGCNRASNDPSNTVASAAKATAIPTVEREAIKPLDQYLAIPFGKGFEARGDAQIEATNQAFKNLYWAAAPKNYDLLAYDSFPEYRKERNEFARSDMVKARGVELDKLYDGRLLTKSYAAWRLDGITVGPYDSAKKGFPIWLGVTERDLTQWQKPNEAGLSPPPTWGLRLIGMPQPGGSLYYVPKTEDEARAIEGQLATLRTGGQTMLPLATRVLSHAVGVVQAKDFEKTNVALLVVDGVAAINPKTNAVLFIVGGETIGKEAQVTCKSSREVLHLPESPDIPMGFESGANIPSPC
jgi:hypothetical protein